MNRFDMNCTLLALGLANAVAEDEKDTTDGFDMSAGVFGLAVSQWLRGVARDLADARARIEELEKPINMILHCPACLEQHIDGPERSLGPDNTETLDWDNPPHRSHLCHKCGFQWRPADVATNGVAAIKTKGKDDMVLIDGPLEVMRQIRIRDAAQPTLDWEGDRP